MNLESKEKRTETLQEKDASPLAKRDIMSSSSYSEIEKLLGEEEETEDSSLSAWEKKMEQTKDSIFPPHLSDPSLRMSSQKEHAAEEELSEESKPAVVLPDDEDSWSEERHEMKERVLKAIQTVYDPEIPVNIHELGLVYRIYIHEDNHVTVLMTLTSPNCPEAQSLPAEVKMVSSRVHGVQDTTVEIVWDPPWEPTMMSEAAQLELGFF